MKCARGSALVRAGIALLSLAVCGARPGGASARGAEDQAALNAPTTASIGDEKPARTTIVMGWIGDLTAQQRSVLRQLLESELAGKKPSRSLELRAASGATWDWIENAQRDPEALLIVCLELQGSGTWRVYLVDAARSRAIVRELPGEARGNSAALETVVSVVSSAVRALDEGLEIASRPVAEVLNEARPDASSPSEPRQHDVVPVARRLQLLGGLGSAFSTFAQGAPLTLGAYLSGELALPSGLLFRVSVLPNWPSHFQTEFGNFEVQRSQAALSVGAGAAQGAWQFSFDAGPSFELLRRRALLVGSGARPSANTSLTRTGAELTLMTRYRVSKRFALELALTGAYFPERIRYTLLPATERVLASPWLASASAHLGLEFWLLQ